MSETPPPPPPAQAQAPPPPPPPKRSMWERVKGVGRPITNFVRTGLVIIGFTTVASSLITYYTAKRKSQDQLEALKHNPNKKILLELSMDTLIESKSESERYLSDNLGITTRISVYDVERALELAKKDPRVVGVLATMDSGAPIGVASVQELDAILQDFKAAGKPAWVHSYFIPSANNMALVSSFDKILMLPGGIVAMPPLASTQLFFKRFLNDKLGVKMIYEKRSEYKNAPNPFTEEDFTPAHREALHSLLVSLHSQIRATIIKNRKLDPEKFASLSKQGFFVETDALETGLIDGICHRNQIEYDFDTSSLTIRALDTPTLPSTNLKGLPSTSTPTFLASLLRRGKSTTPLDPDKKECYHVKIESYLKSQKKKITNPDIAVVFADGTIHKGRQGDKVGGQEGITEEAMAKTFQQIIATPSIKAVVIRLSSPGGDANVSEAIWGHIRKTQATGRKVIVSMGEYAASGGYYFASPADKVIAHPGTITGSIGIFFGKPILRGMMEKLDVNVASLSSADPEHVVTTQEEEEEKAEYGLSPFHEWKGHNKETVGRLIEHNYNLFKLRVAEGRQMKVDDVERIARGRVWTGEEAKKIGLVDELGGLNDAINAARDLINKPDATVTTVNTATFRTVARSLFSGSLTVTEALTELTDMYRELRGSSQSEVRIQARGPTLDV